jgi:hypothetical protein
MLRGLFCSTLLVLVTASALRHGWSAEDVRWAVEHALVSRAVETRQPEAIVGVLHLGPAGDGRLLEVLVIMNDDGEEIAIHAMLMRASYRSLLEEPKR